MTEPVAQDLPELPAFEAAPDWTVQRELLVDVPAAAQLLGGAESRRYLIPFMQHPATVAAAADELQVKRPAMQYWVNRFVDVGLLRLWGVERRGRHRVQWFRCVADHLRVSLAQLPIETHEDVLVCVSERFERLARRSIAQSLAGQAGGLELTVRHQGAAGGSVGVQARPGAEVIDDYVAYWARLWLSADQEAALRQELDALWDRFAALSSSGADRLPVLLNLKQVRDRTQ